MRDTSGYRGVFLAVITIIIIECVLYQELICFGSICSFFTFFKEFSIFASKLIKRWRRNWNGEMLLVSGLGVMAKPKRDTWYWALEGCEGAYGPGYSRLGRERARRPRLKLSGIRKTFALAFFFFSWTFFLVHFFFLVLLFYLDRLFCY